MHASTLPSEEIGPALYCTIRRIMLEDHFYWCCVLERWVYQEGKDFYRFFPPTFFSLPSWVPKWVHLFMYKRLGRY